MQVRFETYPSGNGTKVDLDGMETNLAEATFQAGRNCVLFYMKHDEESATSLSSSRDKTRGVSD